MTLSIDDFRQALDIIGDSAGAEAAIVAQFALDLAVTTQFHSEGGDFSTCALRATVRRKTKRAVRSTRRRLRSADARRDDRHRVRGRSLQHS